MTPVPAAAARNTNTVVEGESAMTDEEITQATEEITEVLDRLHNSEKPLTKEEQRRKRVLSARKQLLRSIKVAREKSDRNAEIKMGIEYYLITSLGEKHPVLLLFLAPIVKSKFGWSVF